VAVLKLSGKTYAYLTSKRGLWVVDVSNPSTPTEVGFYEIYGSAKSVTVAPGVGASADRIYAYVAAGAEGLRVIDVSNPADPIEVGFYDPTDSVYDVDLFEDSAGGRLYAYLTLGSGGLRVLDVSYISGPEGVGEYEALGRLQHVTVTDGRAYVGDNADNLWLMDVGEPVTPTILGRYEASELVNDVAVATDTSHMYVATDLDLRVVDVSNPVTPTEVGTYGALGLPKSVVAGPRGEHVYLAAYDGLEVVDISNPVTPTQVGSYETPGFAYGVDLSLEADYAYVADEYEGLRVVDVSNPVTPTEIGYFATTSAADDVVVNGALAYLDTHNLVILDVSNPVSPTEMGSYVPPSYVANVALAPGAGDPAGRTYAYVTTADDGLRVVDATNPANPTEVSHYETLRTAHVAAAGDYVYLASGAAGFYILKPIIYPNILYLPLTLRDASS
jgi:hypothetical protein